MSEKDSGPDETRSDKRNIYLREMERGSPLFLSDHAENFVADKMLCQFDTIVILREPLFKLSQLRVIIGNGKPNGFSTLCHAPAKPTSLS
jgi:hypothetical protein